MQGATRKSILGSLDAEIIRTKGELESDSDCDKKHVEKYLEDLIKQHDDKEGIALEILNLIGGCGFDALQVSDKQDEKHYRPLHRFHPEQGRAVTVVFSDAHRSDDVFIANDKCTPFIKVSEICTQTTEKQLFKKIRESSLRYGETRFSHNNAGNVSHWIEGIEITYPSKDSCKFWKNAEKKAGSSESFIIPFSRNLNSLIGGRGSGKSALI